MPYVNWKDPEDKEACLVKLREEYPHLPDMLLTYAYHTHRDMLKAPKQQRSIIMTRINDMKDPEDVKPSDYDDIKLEGVKTDD